LLSHSNGDVFADTNAERATVSALWYTDGNRYFYSHSSPIQPNPYSDIATIADTDSTNPYAIDNSCA